MKFHHCFSPWKNVFGHHLKNPLLPPLEKILRHPVTRGYNNIVLVKRNKIAAVSCSEHARKKSVI